MEQTDVSATLGKDSPKEARDAALGGLIIVALFLLLLYRFLGLVAVIGLAIYSAFMYGAILIFGVTLTLPGFAGLILTIGVAADSNVVVFERIKEEVRAGKSVRAAIATGYAKGFRTILDANVVTVITALILIAVATADVKGLRPDAPDQHRDLAGHAGLLRRAAQRCSAYSPGSSGSRIRSSWVRRASRACASCRSTSCAAATRGSRCRAWCC